MSKSQGEFPSPKKLCRALHSAVQTLSSKQPTFGLLGAEEAQDGGDVDNNTSVAAPRSVHLARLCMHELGMRREQYSHGIMGRRFPDEWLLRYRK